MFRPLLHLSAVAGVVFALGATSVSAGERFHGGPAADLRHERLQPPPTRGLHEGRGAGRLPPVSGVIRMHAGHGGYGGPLAATGYGLHQPMGRAAYGVGPRRAGLGAWRMAQRGVPVDAYAHRPVDAYAGPSYGAARSRVMVRYGTAPVRYPGTAGYATSGYGYGSTGYGYGGDFSNAYTTGYDDNQTLGYATRDETYGGQPYDRQGYGAPNYGNGGYGYGGRTGWSPPIGPAGGLAVYSPGAYGPGPRIVTIPSHYAPGSPSPLGCPCSHDD